MNKQYKIIVYTTRKGTSPFTNWLHGLDKSVAIRIDARLKKILKGNLGDSKHLFKGIYELRFHFGSGYRVYFGYDRPFVIVLLGGGDKKTQLKDLDRTLELWNDWRNL